MERVNHSVGSFQKLSRSFQIRSREAPDLVSADRYGVSVGIEIYSALKRADRHSFHHVVPCIPPRMHIRWPVAGVVALYVQLLIEKLWELTLVQLAPCRSVSVSLHSSGINFKGIHTTPSVRRE